MPEEPIEIGRFVFGIRILRYPDGSISYVTQSGNENVPIEVVIMQIKTFLKDSEESYFKKHGKPSHD